MSKFTVCVAARICLFFFFLPHFVQKNKNQASNCCPASSKWPFAPVSFLKVLNFLQWLGICLENIFLIGSPSPLKLRDSRIRCSGWETPETFQFPGQDGEEKHGDGDQDSGSGRWRLKVHVRALSCHHGFCSWRLSTPSAPTPKPQESDSGQKSQIRGSQRPEQERTLHSFFSINKEGSQVTAVSGQPVQSKDDAVTLLFQPHCYDSCRNVSYEVSCLGMAESTDLGSLVMLQSSGITAVTSGRSPVPGCLYILLDN